MTRRWRTSLLVWILVVSVLPAVPLMIFAGLVASRHLDRLMEDLQTTVPQRAEAAAAQVEHRLAQARVALAVLASSEAALRGDLALLAAHAQRVAATQPDDVTVSLVDSAGQLQFSARVSSAPMPARPEQVGLGLEPGPAASAPAQILVATWPVSVDGQERYQLRMSVPPTAFTQALQQLAWPQGWVAAVLDPQHIITGRSQSAERFVGQPATASLVNAMVQGRTGIVEAMTKEGRPVYTAVAPVAATGWTVAVGAPRDLLSAEYQRTMGILMGGAVASLLMAGLASLAVSRWLRVRVRELVAAAQEAQAGGPETGADSAILELEPVTTALREARERERLQSGELDAARHDLLTGLSTRAWLLKRARAEHGGGQRADDRALYWAVLFIDLDGFKQINDRFGHERGDRLLAEVGGCILDAVRGHDLAGRWGGDEFVVCLSAPPTLVTAVARAVAERIVSRVAALGDGVACSVGVAVDVAGHSDLDGLIHQADLAMLAAKREGKNQVVLSMH